MRNYLGYVLAVALLVFVAPVSAVTLGISADGKWFTLDGVPAFLKGVSYYGGLSVSTPSWVTQDLDDMVADGFNWIRVWVRWETNTGEDVSIVNYGYNGSFREPYLSRLKTLITECNNRGMIVDLTLSHSRVDPNDFIDIWEQIAAEMLPYRNMYFDIANERDVAGARYIDYNKMGQTISAIKAIDPGRICTASGVPTSADDLEDYFNPGKCDFIAPHLCRGKSSCPAETLDDVKQFVVWFDQKGFRAPINLQEPFRRGYDSWQPVAVDFLRDCSGGKIAEAAAWCLHNGADNYTTDNRPFRCFDMSASEGRLYVQFEPDELQASAQMDEHVGGTSPWVRRYQAEYAEQLSHQIGAASGSAWQATVSAHAAGYLSYGPYINTLPAGRHMATWRMQINSISGSNDLVARIDVVSGGGGTTHAVRNIYRQDFSAANTWQDFPLLFNSSAGDNLEFRTYWYDLADIKLDWITLNIGSTAILNFTDITGSSGTAGPSNSGNYGGHGVQWADVTGDGRPDFYVTMNAGVDMAELFFRNINGAAFLEEASLRGVANYDSGSHGGVWGDLDNDGFYDLVNGSYEPNRVYENDGTGYFTDRTSGSGFLNQSYGTRGVIMFDYDRDGDLDVFCNNWEPDSQPNELYRNNGNFQFTSITTNGLGGSTLGAQGCTEGDYDNDGDLDVLLCRYGNGPLVLMRNASGNFTQQSLFASTSPRQDGATFVDVNNDGWLDVHTMSSVYLGIGTGRLFINNKNGTFTEVSVPDGPGFMAGFEDLDNDGDWDMVYPGDNKVYLNDGSGNFVASTTFDPGTDETKDPRAVAFADIDNDGDMDFYYAQKRYYNRLIRNDISNAGNWIKVKLTTTNGQAGAFGAKVKTYEAGQAGNASAMISFREARSQEGYLGQNEPILHFGVGVRTSVDIQVTYVNGTVSTQSHMPVNCLIPFPAEAPDIAPVDAEPGCVAVGVEYMKQLTLLGGTPPISWSVISAPAGTYVNSAGLVRGWSPTSEQAGSTQTFQIQALNSLGSDSVTWQVEVCDLPGDTVAMYPFTANEEGWTLAGWKAGQYGLGTISWDSASGNPGGNLKSAGDGGTNNDDSCTREGGLMTRQISTEGFNDIQIQYDVIASLNTPPSSGCAGACTSTILGGTCEDKLVVSYSTNGTGGPWTVAQTLAEGIDLPSSWTRKSIDLSGITAVQDNVSFALRFQWQFNTSTDSGRIDNVTVLGSLMNAPPAKARHPNPAHLATDIAPDADLSWTAGDGAISHDVYFGTANPPAFQVNQTGTTFDPGQMNRAQTYYWRIDERNDVGVTTGDVWQFTVQAAPGDFDGDGDVDLADFGYLQRCYSGSGVPPISGCTAADLSGDNDVDQADFDMFKACFGGANQPSGC